MQVQAKFFPTQILELYAQISCAGKLTRSDKLTLESALSQGSLNKEEKLAIERLLYAIRRGYFQLVDR